MIMWNTDGKKPVLEKQQFVEICFWLLFEINIQYLTRKFGARDYSYRSYTRDMDIVSEFLLQQVHKDMDVRKETLILTEIVERVRQKHNETFQTIINSFQSIRCGTINSVFERLCCNSSFHHGHLISFLAFACCLINRCRYLEKGNCLLNCVVSDTLDVLEKYLPEDFVVSQETL